MINIQEKFQIVVLAVIIVIGLTVHVAADFADVADVADIEDSPTGANNAEPSQASMEERMTALVERVRNGGGYCDGVANILQMNLDRALQDGRWGNFQETLGKAQARGCI